MELTQNKSQNRGVFFAPEKPPRKTPQLTTNSPRFTIQRPHQKHTLSQNPPSKTPVKTAKPGSHQG
jgi:hypothetical protein